MTIGVYSLELHLPQSRSLKNKRQVLRRVKDRLRSRFNLAVAEDEQHGALWQRAGLVLVSVSGNRDALERLFESAHRELEGHVPGSIIELGCEYIDGASGEMPCWEDGAE